MILRDILSRSIFGTVGTILHESNIDATIWYVRYNLDFLKNFNDVLFSMNGDHTLINRFKDMVTDILKGVNVNIIETENLGHTFGTILSDLAIFEYVKNTQYDYVWKFSNDVVVNTSIFDIETTKDIDFYYINNIGYNVFNQYKKEELVDIFYNMEFIYPQTNYYILKKDINFYPDRKTLYDLYHKYHEIKLSNPGIQPWHAIDGCDCEHMLRKTVSNNNLKKQYMLSKQSTEKIINFIFDNQIHDGSHKNIMYTEIGNICHLQYPNHPVAII